MQPAKGSRDLLWSTTRRDYTKFRKQFIRHPRRHLAPPAAHPAPVEVEFALNTPQPGPLALLQQLESAGLGEKASAPSAGAGAGASEARAGIGRGFAFTIEELNLVVPFAAGLRIARSRDAQPLPLSREWVAGIIHIRGEIYTLIDFARFIGRRAATAGKDAGLLLLADNRIKSALLLDSPVSLRAFNRDPPAGDVAGFDAALSPFLSAVWLDDGQPWGVLDVAALTRSARFVNIGR